MIDRSLVESILRTNGIAATESDEVIKSVLVRANWHEEDVETALTVLRENTITHETKTDSLHKIFRSDERLKPETISALLGVEVELPPKPAVTEDRTVRPVSRMQLLQIVFISATLGLGGVLFAMWFSGTGVFHHTF